MKISSESPIFEARNVLPYDTSDPIPLVHEDWKALKHRNGDVSLAAYSIPGQSVVFRMTERSFLNLCATIGAMTETPDHPQSARMTEDSMYAPTPVDSLFDTGSKRLDRIATATFMLIGAMIAAVVFVALWLTVLG